MSDKKYRIRTVQDMIDCTNKDNIDSFLIDLKQVIMSAHELQEKANSIKKSKKSSQGKSAITCEHFDWIDDGKNDLHIELKAK